MRRWGFRSGLGYPLPMLRLAVAPLVLLVGLPALAQQVPADVEAALRKWGIPTSTEVRSLENRIWVTGADALDAP